MGYRCGACGQTFEQDALGLVCEHFLEQPGITYRAGEHGPVPDTACTGCEARRDGDPQTTIRLRTVCVGCYPRLCEARIAATDDNLQRGWALGGPVPYEAMGMRPAVPMPAVVVGGYAKLMFSRVPTTAGRDIEHMWIEVTARDGEWIIGTLASNPEIITGLAEGARIETTIAHVVDAGFHDERVPLPGDHSCPMCVETGSPRRTLDDGDRKLLGHVRTLGWSYVVIPDDDEGPGWGFTIGLQHSFAHPELLVRGLPPDTTKQLIGRIGARVRAGERFEPGHGHDGLLEGLTCRVVPFDDAAAIKNHLGYALWFYAGAPFPVLELVWDAA